jgi:hypothetical protein
MTLQKIDTLSSLTAVGSAVSASPDGTLNNASASPSSNVLGNTANTPGDTLSLP